MFNTTLNNISVISWQSVLLVEETGGSGENHRPVAICMVLCICLYNASHKIDNNSCQTALINYFAHRYN